MDLSEKERFGFEKKGVGYLSCHTSSLATAEWNQIGSVSLVDSFDDGLWNQSSNTHSSTIGKPVRLSWNPSSSHTKGGMFITDGPQMHPLALSHVPSDSGFIERAARFSCFGGAVNPFAFSDVPNSIASRVEAFNDRSNSECEMKDLGEKGNNEFSELEFNGEAQEEPTNSSKGVIAAKKRKRSKQGMELDQSQAAAQSPCEAAKDATDTKKEEKNSSTMATVTPSGKNSKESVEAPKEDYIHVRARRGQATNSHSLAERVRRERISERMKFLQYLVPGCSKVTGKAVMLDEIINYVQSLQRQVEFLSMKLAAVNPRMDFHIEGLSSKNLFQNRGGSSSSTIGFSHDMIHHQLHPPHQSFIQVGMHGVVNPLETFRRSPNVQLPSTSGFKDATQQVPNALDDHLQNVLNMTYGNNPALKTQDLNGVPGDAFTL